MHRRLGLVLGGPWHKATVRLRVASPRLAKLGAASSSTGTSRGLYLGMEAMSFREMGQTLTAWKTLPYQRTIG